ncbi:MAG: hypothetical protein QOJ91_2410 [Sphingomonadales bacterium]|nr:hypothetical protein [Sphingomonadales bacterium]
MTNFNGYRWAFQITPNYSWWESWAYRHCGSDVCLLVDEMDAQPTQFLFASRHLEDLDDPQDVADRAAALKALMDGALTIRNSDFHPFPLEQLIGPQARRYGVLEGNPLVEPYSEKLLKKPLTYVYGDLSDQTDRLLFQSRHDRTTRDMLSFMGVNGATWIALYAMRDYMRKNGWDDAKIGAASSRSAGDVSLFARTANNPAAIGPLARHGDQGHIPPPKPMTLELARGIILTAVAAFLGSRGDLIDIREIYRAARQS